MSIASEGKADINLQNGFEEKASVKLKNKRAVSCCFIKNNLVVLSKYEDHQGERSSKFSLDSVKIEVDSVSLQQQRGFDDVAANMGQKFHQHQHQNLSSKAP